MKRKLSIVSMILVITTISAYGMVTASATPINHSVQVSSTQEKNRPSPQLNGIDKISIKNSLIIDGKENLLYRTFDDQENAIEGLKNRIPELLQIISKTYSLSEISNVNWKDYKEKMYSYMNEKSNTDEFKSDDIEVLKFFFDIYENKDKNDEIMNLVSNNRSKDNLYAESENSSDVSTDEIAMLLPYTSPAAQKSDKNIQQGISANSISGFYAYDGAQYAERFADNANSSGYGDLGGGDCTNFVSQILEAGGVNQVWGADKYSGWWHSVSFWIHSYSRSWTWADTFCRYMGVGYSTSSLNDFSGAITPGDFIAGDWTSDGDWDHCAFVDQTGTYNTYGDKYYQDFKVAQHSDNYCKWASEEKNHWENVEQEGGTYARVRR